MTNDIKVLHVISDEKFPDAAYRQFEAVAPSASTYLLPNKKSKIKHLKEIEPTRVSRFLHFSKKFIKSLEQYDAIIFHSLTPFALEIIGRASPKVRFVWIGMGYDYYDLIYSDTRQMLESETSRITQECLPNYGGVSPRNPLKKLLKKLIYPYHKKKKELAKRISIFSPVLSSEYEFVKQHLKGFSAQHVRWNYGAQSKLIDGASTAEWVEGKGILIGNSATPTNNHMEIFRQLEKMELSSDTKIIVPLSYGNPAYRDRIIQEGEKILGDKFHPITEFLEFSQYVTLLKSCPIIIMNHKRQQGAGAIGIGMFLGAKVFMHPESLLYREHKDQGLTVFQTSDLHQELSRGLFGLKVETAAHNREFLQKKKSFRAHKEQTRALLDRVVEMRDTDLHHQ